MRKIVLLFVCVTLAGCGGAGYDVPDTADVSGTVTLDGDPVEGIEVHFMSDKFTGYGKTDSQGRYQLIQGAVPGENKVFFSKIEGGDVALDPEAGMDEMQLRMSAESQGGAGGPKLARELIPAEYSDPAKSKLTFPVPEGGTNKADFRLQSK